MLESSYGTTTEGNEMCQTCGGKTWIGEPWAPSSCPDCWGTVATKVVADNDNPWEVKA